MRLIVVHFHLRPGGIRRVIEMALPSLLRSAPCQIEELILATGELPDRQWEMRFRRLVQPVPIRFFVEPAFGYVSEQTAAVNQLRSRIAAALQTLLAGPPADSVIWAHNLAVGRNLLLADGLARICASKDIRLVAHHHDWWFDNRWHRWPEMRRCGFRQVRDVARAVLPCTNNVRHFAINQGDARVLRRFFGRAAAWLPNLNESPSMALHRRKRLAGSDNTNRQGDEAGAAHDWLARCLDERAPFWLLPCRLLRRKNVAEALLLARWLRPEAWLVTTGAASSADEEDYANRLSETARRHHWRLRLAVLGGDERNKPSVASLLGASECVMLTSIQEGFGLPYLEAAAARRPLIARMLPNVAPDLARFGFKFPYGYSETIIDGSLFDWAGEVKRQRRLFSRWRSQLPARCQQLPFPPLLLQSEPGPIAFSRLTLTAQLEVLAQPVSRSWECCVSLNPRLAGWRSDAAREGLRPMQWPAAAGQYLSSAAYARGFWRGVLAEPQRTPVRDCGIRAQNEFMRQRLAPDHLFPLLWSVKA